MTDRRPSDLGVDRVRSPLGRGRLPALVMVTGATLGTGDSAPSSVAPEVMLPFAERPYVLGDELEVYAGFMMSGGPPPDGIPAIEDPVVVGAEEARLEPGDMIIGFVHAGEARAYPQSILVYHEIVNDRVGGLPVAITYCPLTATAQGFERGDTTFGVSGQLLNSNLVLFDRETGSHFSQIGATGITGEHRGRTLVELDLAWTTWERWVARHPDTKVLSTRTGYLRNYLRDPYGSYNPLGGYYAQEGALFPTLHASGRHHAKTMIVGARTDAHSVYFSMDDLARERVQSTPNFLAVHDVALGTGHIYHIRGEAFDVVPVEAGQYAVGGVRYGPGDLPFEAVVPVQGFFFAWHAFYPESEFPD